MSYQDKWLHGKVIEKGYRDCAHRYDIVKAFCDEQFRQDDPFTVCDLGANWCYFGLRLTEDFPACSVLALESTIYSRVKDHLKANKADRILLQYHIVSLDSLRLLRQFCRFDLVLGLSIIHHFSGEFHERLDALRGLGDNLIVEFPMQDSPRVKDAVECEIPEGGKVLGLAESHRDKSILRPLVLFSK